MSDLPIHRSRALSKDEKLAETGKLTRAYKQWQREQLAEALAGAHGAVVAELMALLDRLELDSAAVLLNAVRRTDWTAVSYDTRLTVLHQINETIARVRERNGMPAIDDPLPGERDSLFRRIKHTLFPPLSARADHSPSEVATAERVPAAALQRLHRLEE
jgi:hypothetical protein